MAVTPVENSTCTIWGNAIAYKTWHNNASERILALHGWLDNAGSFDLLAPLLETYQIVAPDLAGHGFSAYRSADSAYNLWQDAGDMAQLITQLNLSPLVAMGHSRGAMASVMLAALYPEKIRALVLLDGLMPVPVTVDETASLLRQAFDDKQKYLGRPPRRYETYEEAIQSRLRGPLKLSREAVAAIAQRGLAEDAQGYYWRADPRLRGASEMKLTMEHARDFVRRIQCPTLLLAAMPLQDFQQELVAANDNIRVVKIGGGHHFHLEQSRVEAAVVIGEFLKEVNS